MRSPGDRAFSLIELLVSLAVVGLGLLALMSVFSASLNARSKSANLTAATHLASSELERTLESAINDVPAGSKSSFWGGDFPAPNTPFREEITKLGGTEFESKVFATTVFAPQATNRLKYVEVVVTWAGGEKRGQGRLQATASRLVTEP